MRRLALILPLLLAAPALAQGPAPRERVAVEGASVTLGDLFENAGPRAGTALGPAPGPGRTIVIEAPQLAAIARDYGLAWRPLSGGERVVLERPGRLLPREAVQDALRAELGPLGADPELDFDFNGFQPPVLPSSAGEPRVAVDQPSYDAATKRFGATLVILADGTPTQRIPVAGRMVEMRDAVVAVRSLRRDETIRAEDIRVERLRAERLRPGTAEREELVVGTRLRRAVTTGATIGTADVVAVPVVARDSAVTLLHEIPGMSLAAQGRAQDDGVRGAVISVLNLANGSLVMAEVLGPGRVRALGPAPAADRARQRAAR
jgi:flagella basal body P-ring formation protein FlgA